MIRQFQMLLRDTPKETPSSPILDEPWRKFTWEDNKKNLQFVQEYKPENKDVKHLRVLLYGPVGAGKSSFINSVSNVLQGRITIPAAESSIQSDTSFTKKYKTHKLRSGRGDTATFYPLVFSDIMGLEEGASTGIKPEDIKLAMEGHVTDGHKFNPVTSLSNTDTDYNKNPTEDDKVHLLVCVISANATEIKESVLQKMNSVRETACDLGIPQIAILTKIDEACPETEKDLKKLYKSKHLSKKMKYFSSATGIPQKCIFPVKNYSDECEPNEDVDTLILAALRKMIEFGDDFIEHMKYQVDKN